MFVFKLASHLHKTVEELSSTMTSSEFNYWIAYNNLNLFGDERADWRIAQLTAFYGNWKRSPNTDRFKTKEFLWTIEKPEAAAEQTPEDVDAAIDAMFLPFLKQKENE
jgi:hypothetical protein